MSDNTAQVLLVLVVMLFGGLFGWWGPGVRLQCGGTVFDSTTRGGAR